MPDDLDEPDELTAYHEAGHAVMAFLQGARVRRVTICPDRDDGPNRYGDTEVLWPRKRLTPAKIAVAEVSVCLAGPVAEMVYSGDPYHPAFVKQWAVDWQTAWVAAAALEADEKRRMQMLESVTREIYRRFCGERLWATIAALADELLAHDTLESEEVEQVMQDWLNP